ncbi:hypothetical protein TNCV_4600181, partial [Trichonephila clavipes]
MTTPVSKRKRSLHRMGFETYSSAIARHRAARLTSEREHRYWKRVAWSLDSDYLTP